jgi:Integrase core domain
MSDNGPQMTSGSTREFMALCAIHQHFGRPGTPTDQAWIESLFGHVKAEWPHLTKIRDPATLRAELAVVRERYNGVRLHAGIGYVTPTTSTKAAVRRSARPARPDWSRPGYNRSPTIAPTAPPTRPSTPSTTCPRSPAMSANRSGIRIANSETGQGAHLAGSRQRQIRLCQASTTGRPPIGRSGNPHHASAVWSGPHAAAHAADHRGCGLDDQLPLTTHQFSRDELEAIQAEQHRPGRTTVLTHPGNLLLLDVRHPQGMRGPICRWEPYGAIRAPHPSS